MSSEKSDEFSRLLGESQEVKKTDDPMLPAQHANEGHAKTSIFKLTYSDGSETQVFLLPEGETLAGRSRVCNLVIKDPSASRRHARFDVRAGRCFVEDLGSSAGTRKNGEFITRAELQEGDVVSLGQLPFTVREPAPEQVALSGMHTFKNATVTLPIARFTAPRSPGSISTGREIDSTRLVALLSDVSCELVRSTSLSQILDRIVALTFEMTHADRAFLMLVDEQSGELVPRVARCRDGTPSHGATISRTIAGTVFRDRVALLASDAQLDSRFEASESIPLQNVRSCMCAPLWHDTEVIGILYVDNPESSRFSVADLNLFTTLSNYAAVAIEHARLAARLLQERRHRERLQRYHSPRVIERILEGENETGAGFIAQERQISVLFADIVGFTTISEQMTPPEVAKLLNQFFEAMIDVIFAHEGTLDKFIGDAILATFGAALPQQDHAVRCVRAALDMRKALAGFNAKRGQPELRVRIAINSGCALVGDIGSPKRREFTVLGDVVNTASRLESGVAQPEQIIISGATYQLVKDEIEARALGSVNLRGRSGPVDIYEV
ncbi:MAG: adenylate/guanylate cyclase domain-containing protein [Acidobacteriaceae bacterium]